MAEKKPSAEEIFRKNSEEMSDVERMMAEILQEKEAGLYDDVPGTAAGTEEMPVEKYTAPAPPRRVTSPPRTDANFRKPPVSDYDSYGFEDQESDGVRYGRKKNSRKKSEKKSVTVIAVILIACAVLVIATILIKALSEDLPNSFPGAQNAGTAENSYTVSASSEPEETVSPDIVIPTPDGDGENVKIVEPGSVIIFSDSGNEETDAATATDGSVTENGEAVQAEMSVQVHSYTVYREDVSWTVAQMKCTQLGGHLANVSSQEELNEIISMAEAQGLEKLWIGCHRENAQLVWENDEAVEFYKWGKGEPSGYDSGDRVTEDYILLWKINGEWVYNDSRDDPVKDYPAMYSGQIGYVCEFGG